MVEFVAQLTLQASEVLVLDQASCQVDAGGAAQVVVRLTFVALHSVLGVGTQAVGCLHRLANEINVRVPPRGTVPVVSD